MKGISRLAATLCLLLPWQATARDICDYYEEHYPDLFRQYCEGTNKRVQLGGAAASFADAFNLNPSSIPTKPTPIGVEVIATSFSSNYAGSNYNFAVIRGFQRIGAAISTNSDNTFYSNKIPQGPQANPYVVPDSGISVDSAIPTINFGTSLNLASYSRDEFASPSIGGSIRYNRLTGGVTLGLGASFNSRYLTIGISGNQDGASASSAKQIFYTATVGVRFSFLQVDYNYIENSDESVGGPIHLGTATAAAGPLLLTAAGRTFTDVFGSSEFQEHFAIQFRINRFLSLGYLYNYIPGTQSLGAQLFFL
ncbi:MAG TPA: hypothetical protein VM598_05420 [Bdellovibrionota bacterium]|nr:hypothetical protein [Bdellovibrionota bacterium]